MNSAQREKYSRQLLFGEIGELGQERLLSGRAVIVGCGALGTVAANLLVRAGVGRLRIIDRDFVEASNLQRQTLFEEQDAREALPKAIAAERRLRAINSDVIVEGMVADLTSENAKQLLDGFSVAFVERCGYFDACPLDLCGSRRKLWRHHDGAARRDGVFGLPARRR